MTMTPEERARGIAFGLRTASRYGWAQFNETWLRDAITSALLAEREAATRAEREAVVALLRDQALDYPVTDSAHGELIRAAERIQSGEHTPTDAGGGGG